MDKAPFVKIGKAGNVRLKGNEVAGRQLLDAAEIDGSLIAEGNKEILPVSQHSRKRAVVAWCMGVVAMVVAAVIASFIA